MKAEKTILSERNRKMRLYEKLFRLRKQKGITQQELAEILNVSRQAVSRWEMGTSIPSIENLILISKFYGTDMNYLLDEEKEGGEIKVAEEVDKSVNSSVKNVPKRNRKMHWKSIICLVIGAIIILTIGKIFNSIFISELFLFGIVSIISVFCFIRYLNSNISKNKEKDYEID